MQGNLAFGTGGLAYYDGSSLAINEDVVVVTINYRTNSESFWPLTFQWSMINMLNLSLRFLQLTRSALWISERWLLGPKIRIAMGTREYCAVRRRSNPCDDLR